MRAGPRRRRLIGALVGLLAAGLAVAPRATGDERAWEIVPGERLGPIRLGASYDELVGAFGPPDVLVPAQQGTIAYWAQRALVVIERNGALTGAGLLVAPGLEPAVIAEAQRLRTRAGVAVGAPAARVLAALGQPTMRLKPDFGFLEPWGLPARGVERWNYRAIRLYVDVFEDTAIGLGVYQETVRDALAGQSTMVVPGRSVGPIPLGVPTAGLIAVIGPPAQQAAGPHPRGATLRWLRPPEVLEIRTDAGFLIDAAIVRTSVLDRAALAGEVAAYATEQGVGLAMPAAQAAARLPGAPSRRPGRATFAERDGRLAERPVEVWTYPFGLLLEILDGRVAGLGAWRPRP
jgi:hypothetical protein